MKARATTEPVARPLTALLALAIIVLMAASPELRAEDYYLGLRWYDLSRNGAAYQDLFTAMTGVRLRF